MILKSQSCLIRGKTVGKYPAIFIILSDRSSLEMWIRGRIHHTYLWWACVVSGHVTLGMASTYFLPINLLVGFVWNIILFILRHMEWKGSLVHPHNMIFKTNDLKSSQAPLQGVERKPVLNVSSAIPKIPTSILKQLMNACPHDEKLSNQRQKDNQSLLQNKKYDKNITRMFESSDLTLFLAADIT